MILWQMNFSMTELIDFEVKARISSPFVHMLVLIWNDLSSGSLS
jgi:hypothetical protein